MYGYVLSSRSTTLNFGRYCLIRLCSSAKASRALATRMVSRSAISRANDPVLALTQLDYRKYERTRLRREIALPTYRTVPPESRKRYTPGASGNRAAFSRGSILFIQRPTIPAKPQPAESRRRTMQIRQTTSPYNYYDTKVNRRE